MSNKPYKEIENIIRDIVDSEYFSRKIVTYTHRTCDEIFRKQEEIILNSVKKTLLGLGLNADDPLSIQRDWLYLRKLREGGEDISKWSKKALWIGIISAALITLWNGITFNIAENIDSLKGMFKSNK